MYICMQLLKILMQSSCISHFSNVGKWYSFMVVFFRYFSAVAAAVGMYVAFWIFGVCCVVAFFFTLFVVPETKGKSLTEIQDILAGRYGFISLL
jgi:hypothetical protein